MQDRGQFPETDKSREMVAITSALAKSETGYGEIFRTLASSEDPMSLDEVVANIAERFPLTPNNVLKGNVGRALADLEGVRVVQFELEKEVWQLRYRPQLDQRPLSIVEKMMQDEAFKDQREQARRENSFLQGLESMHEEIGTVADVEAVLRKFGVNKDRTEIKRVVDEVAAERNARLKKLAEDIRKHIPDRQGEVGPQS